jgi:phenylacetate-CoA ligase
VNSLSTALSKRLYYPLLDTLKRMPVQAVVAEASANQNLTFQELRDLQLRQLRTIAAHAEGNCSFYAQQFRGAGVRSSDIACLDDIRQYPLLAKADLLANLEELRSAKPKGREFCGSTSGSTGIASVFYYDSLELAWVLASVWRGRAWWGIERGDPEVVLWGRPLAGGKWTEFTTWLKYLARNSLQFNTFREFDDCEADRIVASIRRWQPKVIYGYGSSIARVAAYMERAGQELTGLDHPAIVEFTADTMSAEEIETASRVFNAPVLSAYGASECGGIAQQCRKGRLHISIDQVVVEFLRSDGTGADEGETAEIVITTLRNYAMPLFRYRVGDLGSYTNGPCECGSSLPTMTLQAGKAIDLITTSTKRDVSAHVLDYINLYLLKRGIRGVRQFFVEQTARDSFVLSIVRADPFDPQAVEVFAGKMRELLGDSIEVRTQFIEQVPSEPTGKRRYFKKTFTQT